MAIKGKGKTRSRQVARAPRRGPVPVPVPFFLRRWVQVLLAFIVGVGAMTMLVWATNGIRENRRAEDDAAAEISQKAAVEEWRAKVDVQLQTVGALQYPNPPLVGEQLATVLGQMVRGEETTVTAEQLQKDADALRAAAKELGGVDLQALILDKGFDVGETEWLLLSRSEMARALDTYRQATLIALESLAAEGAQRESLATGAKGVADVGTSLLEDAWRQYLNALRSVGISVGLPGQDAGFPVQP